MHLGELVLQFLDSIPGIGEKTILELLKHFKSTKRISETGFDDLEKVVGVSRAKKIVEYFQ